MSDYCMFPKQCGPGFDCSACMGQELARRSAEIGRLQAISQMQRNLEAKLQGEVNELEMQVMGLRQKVAELEAKVPRWIPVSERLPDFRNDARWLNKRGRCIVFEIDTDVEELSPDYPYWMPLPTTPQEVKE